MGNHLTWKQLKSVLEADSRFYHINNENVCTGKK